MTARNPFIHTALRAGQALALGAALVSIAEAGGSQRGRLPGPPSAAQLLTHPQLRSAVGPGGMAPLAPTTGYAFETVDAPNKLDDIFQITWINNTGQIIQQYFFEGEDPAMGFGHTAALIGGTWTLIDVPGSFTSGGTNANALGQVALSYADVDLALHLAIWSRGQYQYVPELPGHVFAGAQGINELGQVSALYFDSDGVGVGFVGTRSSFVLLAYPGDVLLTIPFMTNNSGTTVGFYIGGDGSQHAFQYRGGQFANLDVPGATFSAATGVNDRGTILGLYGDEAFAFHGFRRDGGAQTEIVVPDSQQVLPYMITNNGMISGTYQDTGGSWHGFVGYPVVGP